VVECGGLENRYGPFWSIEGSNPSPSARQAGNRSFPERTIVVTIRDGRILKAQYFWDHAAVW
jgi:hypothetical protein